MMMMITFSKIWNLKRRASSQQGYLKLCKIVYLQ